MCQHLLAIMAQQFEEYIPDPEKHLLCTVEPLGRSLPEEIECGDLCQNPV